MKIKIKLYREIAFTLLALIFASAFLFVPNVSAQLTGTMSLSPSTGVYQAGGVFTTRVVVNTGGASINAAEGTLEFNNKELSVIGVNQTGSIFNLWTTEPEFSNSAGTITFGGGSPKGYKGSSGTVFSITFRALKASTANVEFRSGVMLAADGKGTNIIGTMRGGVYTINSAAVLPEPEYVAPDNTPKAPQVKSGTHPDGTKWYTEHDVEFTWSVPNDVTNVRLSADDSRGTIPTVFYDSPIKGKQLEDFDEGAWYLHVQFKNGNGWGKVTHFPFKIDSTKPESFVISQVEEVDEEDPRIGFLFEAVDAVSGVFDYEVQIDGGEIKKWKDDGSHVYKVDILPPGEHTMIVRALDGAGNFLVDTITFTVASLGAPQFTDFPEEISSGGILVLRGVSIPESTTSIHIEKRGEGEKVYTVKADGDGNFTFIMDEKPTDGIYKIWALSTDKRGSISEPSEKKTLAVRQSGFLKLGGVAISYLSIVIPLLALLLLAILLALYVTRKVSAFKKEVRREVTEAEAVLHESFTQLHFEVQEHVKKLESARKKRALTKEEEKMVNALNVRLNEAEKIVSKEIRDIKRVK
jgi:hypothetical protein